MFLRIPICFVNAVGIIRLTMSKLRRADYTEHLAGKTIKRVHWNNDEERKCLTFEFTDQTLCSFKFALAMDEEAELSEFVSGNPSKHRKLIPLPLVRPPIKPLV